MSTTASRLVVTTTLWAGATTATSVTRSGARIPVGAIVGGILGGAFLAVTVVFTWMLWGRSIKRQKRKQEKELRNLRITDNNTRRNASALSRPRSSSYLPPMLWPPSSTKVKFANAPTPPQPEPESKQTLTVSPPVPVQRPRPVALSSDTNPSGVVYPRRKKSAERMAAARAPSPQHSDNTSYYSAASGDDDEQQDEEQPLQLVPEPEADLNQRLSRTSSTWSFLLKYGFRRAPSNSALRHSQATSVSIYSQAEG